MIKTDYKKVFTRQVPLFAVQYWYRGERHGFAELTEGTTWYEPLFVFDPRVGTTDVYYDFLDPKGDMDLCVEYCEAHPEAFERHCQEYLDIVATAERSLDAGTWDFATLFGQLERSWRFLAMVVVFGRAERPGAMTKRALDVRARTDALSYRADQVMLAYAEKRFGAAAPFLTAQEIITGILPSDEEIAARRRGYVYFQDQVYPYTSVEDFARTHGIQFTQESETNACTEFKGQIAQMGIARGRVRIVRTQAHMDGFISGDILVSPMTTPDVLPVIRKAGAIVTDEGGITCHAAIVARELKKPCIIGTKIATQVLKDGDEVEVDATKGMVRILKRKPPA